MTIYDLDYVHNRRSSDCVKWRAYASDVLPLWVADMDFVSPEPVVRALRQRVEQGIFGYPCNVDESPSELAEFRQVIVDRMAHRYGWHIQAEDIVFLPGVVTGVNLACHALATPQEGVLVQTPVYPPIRNAAKTTGIQRQEMELSRSPDGSYAIDWQAFEASLTPHIRLFILCNPHNPVGKVFRRDELEHMAEICLQHGVTICSDEIHCDLVYPGYPHIPIASISPEIAQITVTLISPSKTYNIAGLQCSLAIIQNQELRERYLHGKKGLVPWVNLMGIVAGQAAYQEGQEWLDQVLVYLQANRDYLYDYVKNELPGVEMGSPEGTYLAWLDCRQAEIEGSPYQFFLEKARLALNDGEKFGRSSDGFVRLNFACPRSILAEALERMKMALTSRD